MFGPGPPQPDTPRSANLCPLRSLFRMSVGQGSGRPDGDWTAPAWGRVRGSDLRPAAPIVGGGFRPMCTGESLARSRHFHRTFLFGPAQGSTTENMAPGLESHRFCSPVSPCSTVDPGAAGNDHLFPARSCEAREGLRAWLASRLASLSCPAPSDSQQNRRWRGCTAARPVFRATVVVAQRKWEPQGEGGFYPPRGKYRSVSSNIRGECPYHLGLCLSQVCWARVQVHVKAPYFLSLPQCILVFVELGNSFLCLFSKTAGRCFWSLIRTWRGW